MLPTDLLLMLGICVLLMAGVMAIEMKWYQIAMWKSIVTSILLMATGLSGAMLMAYVESGSFGGRSLFGSIFLTPITFFIFALLLRVKYTDILDICAPNICLTLAATKIQCLMDGCCVGKVMYQNSDYRYIRFPSQIVETAVFLIMMIVLLYLTKRGKLRGKIFPVFLVMYAIPRFVLSFLRDQTDPFVIGLPPGAFWSVCAVVIGLVWLLLTREHRVEKQ